MVSDQVELVIVPDPEVYPASVIIFDMMSYVMRRYATPMSTVNASMRYLEKSIQAGIISVNEARARMTIPGGL